MISQGRELAKIIKEKKQSLIEGLYDDRQITIPTDDLTYKIQVLGNDVPIRDILTISLFARENRWFDTPFGLKKPNWTSLWTLRTGYVDDSEIKERIGHVLSELIVVLLYGPGPEAA